MRTGVKINLGLNILGRRDDGFHNLETLFVPSDAFGDELTINELAIGGLDVEADGYTRLEDGSLVSISPCGWDPACDLTVKAYRMLRDEFALPPVRITLRKGAPVGAGLGGGSADCAAAFVRLNELFALRLSSDALARRASALGSDCAFFVYKRPMLGRGRGEILTPYAIDLDGYDIRIVMPEGESVSTAEAYRGVWDAVRKAYPDGRMSLEQALSLPVEQWQGKVCNDFELTVLPAHPRIAELRQSMLDGGAVYAAMSGSGAAVFGLYRKK